MTIRKTDEGDTIEFMLQTKLSLPDADLAPTLGESTVLQLQRASACLRRRQRSLGEQARRIEELSQQLGQAALLAGRPDLTIGDAQADTLLDWRQVNAA